MFFSGLQLITVAYGGQSQTQHAAEKGDDAGQQKPNGDAGAVGQQSGGDQSNGGCQRHDGPGQAEHPPQKFRRDLFLDQT